MDEDEIVSTAAATITQCCRLPRRKRQYARACWVRPWICRRPYFGDYTRLVRQIRANDQDAYRNFCRMAPEDFDELLAAVRPALVHQDTNCRRPISPEGRLAVTLRFLATCRRLHKPDFPQTLFLSIEIDPPGHFI